MADPLRAKLDVFSADDNLDVEDLQLALESALSDGLLSATEVGVLKAALTDNAARFEPAARAYLQALIAGQRPAPPNRVLLAPAPRGAQRELFYSRFDVIKLQEALSRLGHSTVVDGDYGPGTATSVRAFQGAAGLSATGALDTVTLTAMNRVLAARGLQVLDLSPRARVRPDEVLAMRNGANTADNQAIESGLARLGKHFTVAEWALTPDGRFDAATERAVKALQARSYLPATGLVDRATLAALNAALTAAGEAPVTVAAAPGAPGFAGKVELHFYPGDAERKIYVQKDGVLLETYGMVGGQDRYKDDPNNPTVDYGPSPKGTYDVVEVSPHASMAWSWSYVPFGAPLREQGGEVQFQDASGRWQTATGPSSVFAGRNPPPIEKASYYDARNKLLPTWTLNDFGHLRGRLKSAASGALQGHMIHSSPSNEGTAAYYADTDPLLDPAEALSVLHFSHGCEHIHPRDLDEMIAKGYLAPGTRFVVHGYDERHVGPAVA